MPDVHGLTALQLHTNGRPLELDTRARDLRARLTRVLVAARNAKKLKTSNEDIANRVTLLDEKKIVQHLEKLSKELQHRDLHRGAFCIFGGVKNQGRDASLPHFERNDGAWFDFSITVRESGGHLELLAYDFEIRFAPGMGSPFLRFDLNLPDHPNQARELRCHLHPGSDDILVPAPLMSPAEVLWLFIEGARLPTNRAPRTPTAFEASWFKRSFVTANNPADPQELVKQLLAVVGKQEEREIMSIADWYEDRGRQAGLAKGRDEGRDEGLKIGARNLLLKLLRTRFGALPEAAAARIQAADAAQLDVWAERVLTASTLDDVLTVG